MPLTMAQNTNDALKVMLRSKVKHRPFLVDNDVVGSAATLNQYTPEVALGLPHLFSKGKPLA